MLVISSMHIHTHKKKEVFSMFAIERTISVDFFIFYFFFPSHPFFKILMPSCNFGNDILDAIFG